MIINFLILKTANGRCGLQKMLNNFLLHSDEFISEYCWIKPNLDSNYTFAIDLASNRIPFGAKFTGKL